MLLGKCASMQTSSCALERWYGRWGGPSGRAHPYRLCQTISEHRPAFSHFLWTLRADTRVFADIHPHISGCFLGVFFRWLRILRIENLLYFYTSVLVEAVRRDRRVLLRTRSRTMPRSFLVKKYFAKQKPNYSELECQNGEFGDFFPPFMSFVDYEIPFT